ncbi:MAG TPA: Rnase Y domain-containing protein, partial [Anaerovoracaceae bacterium]|nr:Rnase Y domain-containing protein [Anaerovoracaceae bacterium]
MFRKTVGEKAIGSAEQKAKNMILDAENRSETIKKEITIEAKEEAHRMRSEVEREIRERRAEIQRSEKRLIQKEEAIDRKTENLEKKEEGITQKEQTLVDKQHELDGFISKQMEQLERISGYTVEEAKNILLSNIEKEIRYEASVMIKDIESKAKEEADKKAKEIITGAIQRCAADHVAESTVSVVPLPNDEMKGRIIGREGRNIRAIETLTGVDLIIDDTPEAVILSGFDPVRREIARLSLEKLIVDGRIH